MTETRRYPLEGWTLERVSFDFQTHLVLLGSPGESCEVVLETEFVVALPSGVEFTINPGPPFANSEEVLALHGAAVEEFSASATGTLELIFTDGRLLRSTKHSEFESWQVHGAINLLCTPHPGPPWPE